MSSRTHDMKYKQFLVAALTLCAIAALTLRAKATALEPLRGFSVPSRFAPLKATALEPLRGFSVI